LRKKLGVQLRFERERLPAASQKSLKINSGFSRRCSRQCVYEVFRSLLEINY